MKDFLSFTEKKTTSSFLVWLVTCTFQLNCILFLVSAIPYTE